MNYEFMRAFNACSAQALIEERRQKRTQELLKRKEQIDDTVQANLKSFTPLVDEMKVLVNEVKEQNEILNKQIEEATISATQAKKDARKANVFSWVSFGIATLISILALIVSIIK